MGRGRTVTTRYPPRSGGAWGPRCGGCELRTRRCSAGKPRPRWARHPRVAPGGLKTFPRGTLDSLRVSPRDPGSTPDTLKSTPLGTLDSLEPSPRHPESISLRFAAPSPHASPSGSTGMNLSETFSPRGGFHQKIYSSPRHRSRPGNRTRSD